MSTFLYMMASMVFLQVSLQAQSPVIALRDSLFNKYRNPGIVSNGHEPYFVICYNDENHDSLKAFRIVRRINNSIVIVKKFNTFTEPVNQHGIEKSAVANDRWKLSSALEEKESVLTKDKNKKFFFTITANNIDALLETLQKKKVVFELILIYKDAQSAVIKCNAFTLFKLCLQEPELIFADLYLRPQTDAILRGYNRSVSNINLIEHYWPNVNGDGITVGIKDQSIDERDIDLQKRILSSTLATSGNEFHGTAISTLVGGAGNSFYSGKGIAWKCSFFPSSFSNLFPDALTILTERNVSVQNHSYGTQIQSFYGAEAVSYDMQTEKNRNLLHIFSSGNSGTEVASSGTYANLKGFANITGNFKMAKNVVTVAALDTGSKLAAFSSAGPLYDGRLAPQITALGPNGTSDAAAIVSGSIAVLQQLYKDSNAQSLPPASLIKAVLFTAADDISTKGIDYGSGFGLLNIYNAVNCLMQKNYDGNEINQLQVWEKNLTVPAQAANLKITLAWTDTAALVNNNKALVNDLDLEVVELSSGTVYKPWCLSVTPNIDSLQQHPSRKRDSLNTAEQVSIDFPAAGRYLIKVFGREIKTANKQAFNIAYKWDTLNTLRFTNPIDPGDIDTRKNPILRITWNTAVTDTNYTGNLSVTFDNGQIWVPIALNIKINSQSFNWLLPRITAIAQLRIDAPFGTFFSAKFVIAPLTQMNVDFLCDDSLRLSWPKNVFATGYQLYALGDTAFIRPISMVTDTFVVLNRAVHRENIYAVQPYLANGLQASRSIAIDVRKQGVDCYYSSLQAETTGDSVKLILDVSLVNAVDSILFEKVTANGVFLNSVARINSAIDQFLYIAFDDLPASGSNYYRAKIWTAGRSVYTEIISKFHTGKKLFVMYPNPVTKGQMINLMIKENIGETSLQVADMTGRVILSYAVHLATEIKTETWPSGIYVFRLVTSKGKLSATGKLIIQ